ncbi:MAG: zf-HC2 domain-containing protein, partial [Candidatus Eisenbacteria bacterium]|nr:zf-HC2 domain-containing protein [Candidatus Eisenbacteria bacterium]
MTDGITRCPDAAAFASYMMGMLSDEVRERIDRHLAHCERCREHVADVVRLRTDPAGVSPAAAFPRAWARVEERLASWAAARTAQQERFSSVITLLPRPRRVPPAAVDRLAATTATQSSAKLTRSDRELEIYLVSDDPARTRGVLTRVVSPTGELIAEGVSDEFGVLGVPGAIILDPSAARVELILPHATIALAPSLGSDRLIAAGSTELRSLEGHILHLELIE